MNVRIVKSERIGSQKPILHIVYYLLLISDVTTVYGCLLVFKVLHCLLVFKVFKAFTGVYGRLHCLLVFKVFRSV